MKPHTCEESSSCICSCVNYGPKDTCPVHGLPGPLRCGTCGRFMPSGVSIYKRLAKEIANRIDNELLQMINNGEIILANE